MNQPKNGPLENKLLLAAMKLGRTTQNFQCFQLMD